MPRTHTHTVCSCIYQNSISGKWARPCICVEIRDTEGALLCPSNVTLCMNSLSFDKKKQRSAVHKITAGHWPFSNQFAKMANQTHFWLDILSNQVMMIAECLDMLSGQF